MSAATTTQAAVKAALVNALLSNPEITWPITYGDPGDSGPADCIYVGAAMIQPGDEQEPASFRRGHREESYTLTVSVDTGGLDPMETEAGAVAVVAQIEATVIASKDLDVDGVHWITPAGVELSTGPISDGFRTTAKVRLNVRGRLQWQ